MSPTAAQTAEDTTRIKPVFSLVLARLCRSIIVKIVTLEGFTFFILLNLGCLDKEEKPAPEWGRA